MSLEIDCDTEFFQLEVVNERIRGSISQIVKAVNALTSQVSALSEQVLQGAETQKELKSDIETVRSELGNVNSKEIELLREHVEDIMKDLRQDRMKVEEVVYKQNCASERLERQENRVFPDVSKIVDKIDNLDAVIQDHRLVQIATDNTLSTITRNSQGIEESLATATAEISSTSTTLSNLLKLFSISDDVFPSVFSDKEDSCHSGTVEYLLGTPVFKVLVEEDSRLEQLISSSSEKLNEKAEDLTKMVSSSVLQMHQKVIDKLDKSVFESYTTTTSKQLSLVAELELSVNSARSALDQKAEAQQVDDDVLRLETLKADRGDLLKLVSRSDMENMSSEIASLSAKITELSGNTELQLRTLKNGARRSTLVQPAASSVSPSLQSDLEGVKNGMRILDENKVNIDEMMHLQHFTDGIADQVEKITKLMNDSAALPASEYSEFREKHQRVRTRPASSSPKGISTSRSNQSVHQITRRKSLDIPACGELHQSGPVVPTAGSLRRPSTAGPGSCSFSNLGGREPVPKRPQSADMSNPKFKFSTSGNTAPVDQQYSEGYESLVPRSYFSDADQSSVPEIIQLQQLPAGIRMGRPSRLTTQDGIVTNASVTPRVNLDHYHTGPRFTPSRQAIMQTPG